MSSRTIIGWLLLLVLRLFVFFQEVFHSFFEKIIDALIKVNGKLFNIFENQNIKACCERLSFIHFLFIGG